LKSASLQYANALADIALEQGAAEPVQKQLGDFLGAFGESAELRSVLSNPAVTTQEKHRVVEQLAARLGATKIVRNFLFVVVDHRRSAELPHIVKAFGDVLRERRGTAEAEVVSALGMSDAQKSELQGTLEKLTGKKITATYTLDPALLGGAVVRIGDTVYDGSLRSRLNRMREQLAAE